MATAQEHWHRYGHERLTAVTERFVAFVQGLDDQLDRPVPDMDWRAIDVVAHVASVFRRYTVDPRRAADAAAVAAQNAEDLAASDLSLDALTHEITGHVADMAVAIDLVSPDHEFPFHAGQPITLAGGWGNAIGELVAHGDDIARATSAEWKTDGADLEPLWRFTTKVLPGWFTPEAREVDERWELRLGFAEGPVRLHLHGGGITVDEADATGPDHVVEGDALETTLVVPYRRRSTDDPELALLGRRIEPF